MDDPFLFLYLFDINAGVDVIPLRSSFLLAFARDVRIFVPLSKVYFFSPLVPFVVLVLCCGSRCEHVICTCINIHV